MSADPAQPLIEPSVRPRTSCFCTSRMKMKLGTIAVVPRAEMKPHSEPVEVTKVVILTGSVRMDSDAEILGKSNSIVEAYLGT